MLTSQRKLLEAHKVVLEGQNSNIHFGIGFPKVITFEAPCQLRDGRFDIDEIGAFTYLGGGNTWARNISTIGRFCAIAPNLFSGPEEHLSDGLCSSPIFEGWNHMGFDEVKEFHARNSDQVQRAAARLEENNQKKGKIKIGNSVWIGEGVFIRRGVTIHDGAIIGARSVVTKDVAPYSIVAGTPARQIGQRFDPMIISALLDLKWWDYGLAALEGIDFSKPVPDIDAIAKNISKTEPAKYPKVRLDGEDLTVVN